MGEGKDSKDKDEKKGSGKGSKKPVDAAPAAPMSPTAAFGYPSMGYPGFFPPYGGMPFPYGYPSMPAAAPAGYDAASAEAYQYFLQKAMGDLAGGGFPPAGSSC